MSFPFMKLGDAVIFKGGGTPSRDQASYWNGGIPWATVKDLNDGYALRATQEHISQEGLARSASNLIPAGTVIISTRMALGKAVLSEIDIAINQDLKAVVPTVDLDSRFLLWYFIANGQRIEAMGKGATVKGVTLDQLRALQIPLPPLAQQRRIAAILGKTDALRAQRRAAIAKLDELLKSVFIEVFGDPVTNPKGWPIRKIADLLDSVKYGSSDKATQEGEIPILRMNNLTYSGQIELSDLKYITAKQANEKYLVEPGDILFNRTNSKELVGKTAVYDGPVPMAYAGYLVRGRVNQSNAPEYISAFLNSIWGKAILRNMCKNIVGMANINAREFGSIELPVPPSELQRKFQRYVRAVRAQKQRMQEGMKKLDELFACLQQRAFSGKL